MPIYIENSMAYTEILLVTLQDFLDYCAIGALIYLSIWYDPTGDRTQCQEKTEIAEDEKLNQWSNAFLLTPEFLFLYGG